MIFPPIASAVVVLNARVTGTAAWEATRFASAIVITTSEGDVCAVQVMEPDATPADAATSAVVCTVIPVGLSASAAAPIVKPLRVMVKAVFAPMVPTAVVMTMVLPVMNDVAVMLPVAPPIVLAALSDGLGVNEKNPAG